MNDRGYTAGLLIGCVLLLSAGLAFTIFEIKEYNEELPDPLGDVSVRPVTPPAEPEPDEEPEVEDDEGEQPDEEPEQEIEDVEEDLPDEEENGEETAEPAGDDPENDSVGVDDTQE